MNPESVDVTAGLGGFLAFFLLALALYFLMRNMNVRLRRMAYREEQEAKANGTHETGTTQTGTSQTGTSQTGTSQTGTSQTGTEGGPKDGPDLG
jgi:hypothetical protein